MNMFSLCWCLTAVTHTFPLIRCCYVACIIMATYRRKGFSMNPSVLLCIFLLCSNSLCVCPVPLCSYLALLDLLIPLWRLTCIVQQFFRLINVVLLCAGFCRVLGKETMIFSFAMEESKAMCTHTDVIQYICQCVYIQNVCITAATDLSPSPLLSSPLLSSPRLSSPLLSSPLLSSPLLSSPPPYGTLQYC